MLVDALRNLGRSVSWALRNAPCRATRALKTRRRHGIPWTVSRSALAVFACLLVATIGCQDSRRSVGGFQNRPDRSEVLLGAVIQQLGNLAAYVDTELRPPVVILDSRKAGGEDVMATFTRHPDYPEGPINYLHVVSNNGRFRSEGVRPGDLVKFSYVRYDQDSLETDIGETVTIDLTVAQVLDENSLLIQGGLTIPILEPLKIEIWRYDDQRLKEIDQQLLTYVNFRQPVFDWEPSGDQRVLKQIVERLNQWMHQSQPKVEWTESELLDTLDTQLAEDERLAQLITSEALASPTFRPYEGRLLQEAVWHRDISRWAQGDSFDDLQRAAALFDWTIRNIQLDAKNQAAPNRPWQVLLYGHGTAEQRAWVFALLCRQQGLDVVVLSVPGDDGSEDDARYWLPALLHDGQLYLFDTQLGLPIPAANGQGVATLAAVQADESLLRRLDLDDQPYPISADQLKNVTAGVVTSPFDLSRRAKAFENKLSGDDRLVLTSRADELAEKLRALPGIAQVKVWREPYQVLRDQMWIPITVRDDWTWSRRLWAEAFEPFARRPTLWKGRVLQFRGHDAAADEATLDAYGEFAGDHDQAVRIYTSKSVRPTDRLIATLDSEAERSIHAAAKGRASYWVGLLLFDEGNFAAAEDWFSNPKLAAGADDTWTDGTRYNLARTFEAQQKFDEAIAIYEQDDSPQRHGNRLRARQLRAAQAKH